MTSLSYEIVNLGESKPGDGDWVPVRLPSDQNGYVHQRYIRSPIDYRAIFAKEDGRWQMMMFLAGD
jgi:hypothetical protein